MHVISADKSSAGRGRPTSVPLVLIAVVTVLSVYSELGMGWMWPHLPAVISEPIRSVAAICLWAVAGISLYRTVLRNEAPAKPRRTRLVFLIFALTAVAVVLGFITELTSAIDGYPYVLWMQIFEVLFGLGGTAICMYMVTRGVLHRTDQRHGTSAKPRLTGPVPFVAALVFLATGYYHVANEYAMVWPPVIFDLLLGEIAICFCSVMIMLLYRADQRAKAVAGLVVTAVGLAGAIWLHSDPATRARARFQTERGAFTKVLTLVRHGHVDDGPAGRLPDSLCFISYYCQIGQLYGNGAGPENIFLLGDSPNGEGFAHFDGEPKRGVPYRDDLDDSVCPAVRLADGWWWMREATANACPSA